MLVVLALVEAFAPVDNNFLFEFHGIAVLVLYPAGQNTGFQTEGAALGYIAFLLQNPLSLSFGGLAYALAYYVTDKMAEIVERMHTTVSHQNKTFRLKPPHAFLQGRTQRSLVKGIARE